jgi:hypothetical protein
VFTQILLNRVAPGSPFDSVHTQIPTKPCKIDNIPGGARAVQPKLVLYRRDFDGEARPKGSGSCNLKATVGGQLKLNVHPVIAAVVVVVSVKLVHIAIAPGMVCVFCSLVRVHELVDVCRDLRETYHQVLHIQYFFRGFDGQIVSPCNIE